MTCRKSLDTLVPDNPNTPYDMKELILKTADEGDFYEIQEEFAKNIITGFIRLEGLRPGRYSIHVGTNRSPDDVGFDEGVQVHQIDYQREPRLVTDVRAFI